MFLEYILDNFLLVFTLEVGAALAGSFYVRRVRCPEQGVRLFVYYLWLVVLVEFVGLYPVYAYLYEYERLGFIKGTLFERNYWWYNAYTVLKFFILYVFFILQLHSPEKRRKLYAVSGLVIVSLIIDQLFGGEFFTSYSAYLTITGTLFLVILILIYHLEILNSHKILKFYTSMPFYCSIGMLIWHVSITPVFIYNKYFTLRSPDFVNFQQMVLWLINLFLYGILIVGFMVCTEKRKNLRAREEFPCNTQKQKSAVH